MDPVKVGNMQVLFRQHLDALELAMSLGRQYEQTLASLSTQLPVPPTGDPVKQAELSMREPSLTPNPADQKKKGVNFQAELEEPLLNSNRISSTGSNLERDKSSLSDVADRAHSETADMEVKSGRARSVMQRRVKKKDSVKAAGSENDVLKTEGFAQKLRKSPIFNGMCFAAILGNAIWVTSGMDKVQLIYENVVIDNVVENVFCGWFLFELIVWLCAFKRPSQAFKDFWFVTHAIVVGLLVWHLWAKPLLHLPGFSVEDVQAVSLLTVLRLSNTAKDAHILTGDTGMAFYGIAILKGLRGTLPLFFFWSLTTFAFAIALRLILRGQEIEEFGTVAKSFRWLYVYSMGLDPTMYTTLWTTGMGGYSAFIAFSLLGNLTVAKFLTVVLLQVMQKITQDEKDQKNTEDMECAMQELAKKLDEDGNGKVSLEEFEALTENPDLLTTMDKHNIDFAAFIDYTIHTFPANDELTVKDLTRMAKQFWGFRPISVGDIMSLRKLIYQEMDTIVNAQAKSASQVEDDLQEQVQVLLKGQGQIVEEMQRSKSAK